MAQGLLMAFLIADGYPRDEMIYKWRKNSIEAADQKSWRLYQFDFMGLRNTSDILKTTSGNQSFHFSFFLFFFFFIIWSLKQKKKVKTRPEWQNHPLLPLSHIFVSFV